MWKVVLIISFVAALLSACCVDRLEFSGETEVLLRETDGGGTGNGFVADTVRGPFLYEASARYQYVAAQPTIRPAQLLMAMSCEEVYDRGVVAESVRLSLDRGILFQGRPLPAGENLIPILRAFDSPYGLVSSRTTGITCYFDLALLEDLTIPAADYTFNFGAELEDGTPIGASATVYLDFE